MAVRVDSLRGRVPVITGHRGFQGRYPENTLISFQAAVAAGVDVIEMDVHLTRDGVPVIIHDDTVDRTSDGRGRVDGLRLKEIRALDAGGWFAPRFAGQRIPTLAEVLERFGGRVVLNVEIKAHGRAGGDVERAVVREVAQRGLTAGVMISSFDADILSRVRRLSPATAVALIAKHSVEGPALHVCRQLGVFSYHPSARFTDARLVAAMHAAGIRVFCYNADSAADVRRLARLGADGVIAKDPLLARRWWNKGDVLK